MTGKTTDRGPPVEGEISELKARLAIAESERDAWRAAGRQDKYLAAWCMVESLTLRLDKLEGTTRFAAATRARGSARREAPLWPNEAELELMRTLEITFADGLFRWREYRCPRLADAVAYARNSAGRA